MSTPDDALMARIAGRDREAGRAALAELYSRHAGAVLGFLERSTTTGAEDILQDTFLAVVRRASSFRGANARAWLITLASNRLRDQRRKDRRRTRRERAGSRTEAVVDRDPSEGGELIPALARLSPDLRLVIELRHVQGFSHSEVAQALGVSLRTAKQRSRDALDRIRQFMNLDR